MSTPKLILSELCLSCVRDSSREWKALWKEEKGQLTLTEEFQLMHIEEMRKIEIYH